MRRPPPRTHRVVQRMLAAGFVPVGRTNMTEFAFSGLGINPHYGTPRNPRDRLTGASPAVSPRARRCRWPTAWRSPALGTDTGGSCRIPAAFCGIVGLQADRAARAVAGMLPLSPTLDSDRAAGAEGRVLRAIDAVLAGEVAGRIAGLSVGRLRLALPQTMVRDEMDAEVARAFSAALSALSRAGAEIIDVRLEELADLAQVHRKGGFPAPRPTSSTSR